MLAKVLCLSIHTVVTLLSTLPPKSSSVKERADKIKDEKGTLSRISTTLFSCVSQPTAILTAALYINLIVKGIIPGELKTWQVLSAICGISGYLLRSWAYKTLGRFFTYTLMIRRGHRLVQDGPYKYLIHPSYTGLYISLASFLVTLTYDGLWPTFIKPRLPVPVSGLLLLLVHLVFYFGLLFLRIQKEEKMLSQHFGSEWDEYVSRRWRMIPFVY